ncbi:MAG: sigma-70 family RNA polymerase sigma factor [Bacteroidota bacterium]|nr:sigma-70 family RNA polymerase sigma factor [Bacteroidota bacterium]
MSTEEFKLEVLPINQKLYYFALRFLKSAADAEDAVQEVFVKLWKIRDKLGTYNSIEAFAYTVTRNHCLDKLKAKRTYSIEDSMYGEPGQANATPADRTEIVEKLALVKKIISDLPEQQRMVIQLRDIDECTYDEIAQMLDMEPNAIRVNLSRARKKVRDEIAKIYNYEVSGN